jgi:hypothetical protein
MAIEWWIVLATLSGPVLAVQTQKFIERATERRNTRLQIFRALMANRATRLADDFVKALNLIDLVFLPNWWSRRADKAVISAWRSFFDELSHHPGPNADSAANISWTLRCDDGLVELLRAMSYALGYTFTKEELRRGIYNPQGNVDRDQALLAILQGLRNVLSGTDSLRMAVTSFPVSEALTNAQTELARRAASAYDAEHGALKIKQVQ